MVKRKKNIRYIDFFELKRYNNYKEEKYGKRYFRKINRMEKI